MTNYLRNKLIDHRMANSVGAWARERRWRMLLSVFPDLNRFQVVDLGGTVASWLSAPVMPARVTLVNLDDMEAPPAAPVRVVQADACTVGDLFREERFDLVFSNSLIEHVGGHYRRQQLAHTITQLSDCHWIQTPYRYFPIEPHWLFPAFSVFPVSAQARILGRWHLAGWYPKDREEAVSNVLSIELLTRTSMRHYFPDSELFSERVAGLTKSLIAVRRKGAKPAQAFASAGEGGAAP